MAIIAQGKIVVVLSGRFAGRKAVVLRVYENGTKDRKFPHALIAGIEKGPKVITKAMSKETQAKRLTVRPFLKFVNLQHVMPTRYTLDISASLDSVITVESLASADGKKKVKTEIKKKLENRYKAIDAAETGKVANGAKYFFKRLSF